MTKPVLVRIAVALVWLYQGLWCKLLGGAPGQQEILDAVPFLSATQAHAALLALGALECLLAIWIVQGRWTFASAMTQTVLLAGMNITALIFSGPLIPDPVGMLFQNFAFILLAWIAAGEFKLYAANN